MPSRRRFLATAASLALGLAAGPACGPRKTGASPAAAPEPRPPRPLDLLVLGGTGFIGPHLVRHAVARGHRVTIFTRGRRQADLPGTVIRLIGDRNGQLDALAGKRWDAVVDDSATNPAWVEQSTQLLQRGGEVLAPGRRDDPVQFIDVRDLAEFMLHLLETARDGIYNVAGPGTVMTMPEFLDAARAAVNPEARLTWIDDYDFLEAHEITGAVPWVMLKGNDFGHMSNRNDRAIAAGLKFRPLETSVRDTLAWWPTVPEERRSAPQFAITPEQEAKALAAWHARGR